MTESAAQSLIVRVERSFAAPPSRVYNAWLDPEIVKVWMAPGPFKVARAEIEPRVGGRYRIWHASDGEIAGGWGSEILELVPEQRLVFAWGIAGPDREAGPVFDSRLTVTFAENDAGGTDLTLVHEHLDEFAAAMPEVAGQFEAGWQIVLEKLAAL
jgi:uncharacterized protein YndB with AHSA1/START domain